ncbi:suppressor of fused domain protein [Lentzea sp. NPDC051213]|uniref:suppressor of fused domain protein n=1 Tax=Lentzea sp. NPDC051213 TaxID=3364126 RepID=UPI00379DC9FE
MSDASDRLSRYRERLDSLTGAEPVVSSFDPREAADGLVLALAYIGVPEPGYVTGFTYGLSLVRHADWGQAGRELSITVRSDNVEWASVPARIIAGLRGLGSFGLGHVLGHVGPYVSDSQMSSIVLAGPAVPAEGVVDLGDDERGGDLVEIAGVYPIHAAEREFVYSRGFDALWNLEWDRFDPSRESVVQAH